MGEAIVMETIDDFNDAIDLFPIANRHTENLFGVIPQFRVRFLIKSLIFVRIVNVDSLK